MAVSARIVFQLGIFLAWSCSFALVTAGSVGGLRRATSHTHTIELLVVADYSEYKMWLDKEPHSLSSATRASNAVDNVKKYAAALIKSSNVVYKSLEPDNIYVDIKLVDVLVKTTPGDSPWTETEKVSANPKYEVDPTAVLPKFQTYSESLQSSIPHDHAMILTMYALYHGGGSTFSGYAYTEAECKPKSVSIIEDNQDFYTAQLLAHELGHSLGCEHDGNGNSCPTHQGYAMEANFILANTRKWVFSSCSVTYIRNYLNDLQQRRLTCLDSENNHHPSSVSQFTDWYGQRYTADEQCQIKYGATSFFCREQYRHDYSTMCVKLFCSDPADGKCYYFDGGDATPCGNGKWCMSSKCVQSSQASQVPDDCPVGDQAGIVKNGMTCADYVRAHPSECHSGDIQYKCCDSCNGRTSNSHQTTAHAHTAVPTTHAQQSQHSTTTNAPSRTGITMVDVDKQCERRHGHGSQLCRGAAAYTNKTYADVVCWDLQCSDPHRAHWCLSSPADDGTPCGHKKWCVNKQCVYDANAPAVPDDCPWGDGAGQVAYHESCDQLVHFNNHWHCYDPFTAKVCCHTCGSIRRNVAECPYGDKSDWCQTNIPNQDYKRPCYTGHNADLCCESCAKYQNHEHVGCEWGDKEASCSVYNCDRYSPERQAACCDTCKTPAIIG